MKEKKTDFEEIVKFLNQLTGIPDTKAGRSYRDAVLQVTGGNLEKLEKLKEEMGKLLKAVDGSLNQEP